MGAVVRIRQRYLGNNDCPQHLRGCIVFVSLTWA